MKLKVGAGRMDEAAHARGGEERCKGKGARAEDRRGRKREG